MSLDDRAVAALAKFNAPKKVAAGTLPPGGKHSCRRFEDVFDEDTRRRRRRRRLVVVLLALRSPSRTSCT